MKEHSVFLKRILVISIALVSITLVIGLKSKVINEVSNELEQALLRVDAKEYALTCLAGNLQVASLDGKTVMDSMKVIMNNEKIVSYCISDLNNDSTDEILMIIGCNTSEFGRDFVVYSYDNGLHKVYDKSFEGMNPWKVQTSDVDGDGQLEISIAMYKKTKFHPIMAKRPFIYDWNDTSIFPKWRGSRLSKPFDDYIFQDIDQDGSDELLAIELLSNGNKVISAYSWKGFGFEVLIESNEYEDIFTIKKSAHFPDQINVYLQESSKSKWLALKYDATGFLEQAIVEQ